MSETSSPPAPHAEGTTQLDTPASKDAITASGRSPAVQRSLAPQLGTAGGTSASPLWPADAWVDIDLSTTEDAQQYGQHRITIDLVKGILETWRKSKTHAALKALSKQWEDSDGAIVCHFFVELGIGPGHVFLNPADFMVATLTGRNVVPPNHLLLRLEVIGDLYVSSPADWELDSRSVLSKSGWKALQLVETELLKRADDEFKTHTDVYRFVLQGCQLDGRDAVTLDSFRKGVSKLRREQETTAEPVAEVDEEQGDDTSFRGSVTEQLAQMQAAIDRLEVQVAQLMEHAKI